MLALFVPSYRFGRISGIRRKTTGVIISHLKLAIREDIFMFF